MEGQKGDAVNREGDLVTLAIELSADELAELRRQAVSKGTSAEALARDAVLGHITKTHTLSPVELQTRVREGGRIGGTRAGKTRRDRRERFDRGELSDDELASYQARREQQRSAGRLGGLARSKNAKDRHK